MKKLIFFTTCFLILSFTKAQIISSVAGDTTPGYAGDNGLATLAKLNHPPPRPRLASVTRMR